MFAGFTAWVISNAVLLGGLAALIAIFGAIFTFFKPFFKKSVSTPLRIPPIVNIQQTINTTGDLTDAGLLAKYAKQEQILLDITENLNILDETVSKGHL